MRTNSSGRLSPLSKALTVSPIRGLHSMYSGCADLAIVEVIDEQCAVPAKMLAQPLDVLAHERMIGAGAGGRHAADAEPPRFEAVDADQPAVIKNGLHRRKHAPGRLLDDRLGIAIESAILQELVGAVAAIASRLSM